MKRILSFLFAFSCLSVCFPQSYTVKGKVIDTIDNSPIENVNIIVQGTQNGCKSNKDGSYELKEISLPSILQISHISFQTQTILLTQNNIKREKTINLDIKLQEKTINIKGIVIQARPINKLDRFVYDFEVGDSLIYIIGRENGEKYLNVYTYDDYLKDRILLPQDLNELNYDYSNKLAIKKEGESEYYNVFYDKKGMHLNKQRYDIIERGILKTVYNPRNYSPEGVNINRTAWTNQVTLLRGNSKCKYSYSYSYMDKEITLYKLFEKQGKLKYTIIYYALFDLDDWLKDKGKNKNSWFNYIPKYNTKIDSLCLLKNKYQNLYADIKSIRKIVNINSEIRLRTFVPIVPDTPCGDLIYYYQMIIGVKIPVYFIELASNVYIINIDKSLIYKLSDTGLPLDEVKLDKQVANDFSEIKCIFSNQDKTKCYVEYNKFGNVSIKEIDLVTGKYINTIHLHENFVDKVRIVGDNIFYTATKNVDGRDERWLFKQKINDISN